MAKVMPKGKQFSSTYQPKNRGRKPTGLKKYIRDTDISAEDITKAFKYVLGLGRDELEDLIRDKKTNVIVLTAATAILGDITKKKMDNLQTIAQNAGVKPDTKESEVEHDSKESEQFETYQFPEPDPLPDNEP